MDIWELDKLVLFILFIIPGFISLKTYNLIFPAEKIDSSKQIIDAICYSCINYALVFWAILIVEKINLYKQCEYTYYAFYGFIILITPVIWVLLWRKFRTFNWMQDIFHHPVGKPWDYIFGQKKPYWIIVNLKNGEKIGGKYAYKSFSSNSPANEEIYLEERWIINKHGGFERRVNETAGIIILSSEIESIEFYNYFKGE